MTWHQDFKHKGFQQFPGLADQPLVAAARDAIRHDLFTHYDTKRQVEYDHISYCPDLNTKPVIMDLLKQPSVWSLLNSVLGVDKFCHGRGQVAIRKAHDSDVKKIHDAHLDGVPSPYNGVTGQTIDNFTALIGIYLTDTPRPYAGNFTVWPGSHSKLEKYFRDEGPKAADMGMPKIDLGQPKQLDTKAGDVVLCHYQLAHTTSVNTSDVDRIAVYFRISLNEIGNNGWDYLTHIWKGWAI